MKAGFQAESCGFDAVRSIFPGNNFKVRSVASEERDRRNRFRSLDAPLPALHGSFRTKEDVFYKGCEQTKIYEMLSAKGEEGTPWKDRPREVDQYCSSASAAAFWYKLFGGHVRLWL